MQMLTNSEGSWNTTFLYVFCGCQAFSMILVKESKLSDLFDKQNYCVMGTINTG